MTWLEIQQVDEVQHEGIWVLCNSDELRKRIEYLDALNIQNLRGSVVPSENTTEHVSFRCEDQGYLLAHLYKYIEKFWD